MADPAIARRVPRPALAPTAVELAPSAARAIARTRMPIGALSGCLPDQPGIVGLWIDPAGALAVGRTMASAAAGSPSWDRTRRCGSRC
jgi:hypothetical protein